MYLTPKYIVLEGSGAYGRFPLALLEDNRMVTWWCCHKVQYNLRETFLGPKLHMFYWRGAFSSLEAKLVPPLGAIVSCREAPLPHRVPCVPPKQGFVPPREAYVPLR